MGGMNTPTPIQIITPGEHFDSQGRSVNLSEEDLKASAAAYDPQLHEAPIVVGHPKHNDPAYGWIKTLSFSDGLEGEPHQVDPEFAEMFRAGRFKKHSGSFYAPDSPSNPVPGVWYLRHVGFLGAMPPAVKGLRTSNFAEQEQGVVEFGDWNDRTIARVLRGLRNWFIGKFGQEEADKALAEWDVQSIADEAAQPEPRDITAIPNFSEEPTPKGDEMSAEDKARMAALEQENAALRAAEATRKTEARHTSNVSFAEVLVASGKLLPAQKDVAVATLDFMEGQDQVVEFGEGEAKQPLVDGFKKFLEALPVQVDFGEHAGRDQDDSTVVNFAAPQGFSVDPHALEIHHKAEAYMKANNVDYMSAVSAVQGK